MRTKEVQYSRKFNLGNFETEDISVVLELEEGEKAADALKVARQLVMGHATHRQQQKSSQAKQLEAQLKKSEGTS